MLTNDPVNIRVDRTCPSSARERLGAKGGIHLYKRVLSLLLAAVLGAGCAGRKPASEPIQPPAGPEFSAPSVITQTAPIPIAKQLEGQVGVKVLVVTDTGFEPAAITVRAGDVVKLHVLNRGAREHNLVIPRFTIATSNMAPGAENYVEFTADAKGAWPFFSDAPGQAETGLLGSLKVE